MKSSDYKIYHLIKKKYFITILDLFAKSNREFPLISFGKIKTKILTDYKNKIRVIFLSRERVRINFAHKANKIFVVIFDTGKKKKEKREEKKPKKRPKEEPKEVKTLEPKIEKKYDVIVIDPGHGGKDSGAIGYKKRKEKSLVLQIAKKLKRELIKRGFVVVLTRETDIFLELKERTKLANNSDGDIFISIHANSANPKKKDKKQKNGFETYFLSNSRFDDAKDVVELENKSYINGMKHFSKNTFLDLIDNSKQILSHKLAIDLQKGVIARVRKKYKIRDGGVRSGPFWVLVGTTMPSVLVEVGYLSNKKEADNLFTKEYQKLLVKGLADGIANYLKNNKKE